MEQGDTFSKYTTPDVSEISVMLAWETITSEASRLQTYPIRDDLELFKQSKVHVRSYNQIKAH